jgi:hypothetical protein
MLNKKLKYYRWFPRYYCKIAVATDDSGGSLQEIIAKERFVERVVVTLLHDKVNA